MKTESPIHFHILSTKMPPVHCLECVSSLERLSAFSIAAPKPAHSKRQQALIALSKRGTSISTCKTPF